MSQDILEERQSVVNDTVVWSKEIIKATTKLTDGEFETLHLLDRPVIFGIAVVHV